MVGGQAATMLADWTQLMEMSTLQLLNTPLDTPHAASENSLLASLAMLGQPEAILTTTGTSSTYFHFIYKVTMQKYTTYIQNHYA